jgi:hypothetical protein
VKDRRGHLEMAGPEVRHDDAKLLRLHRVFGSTFLQNCKTGELVETGEGMELGYSKDGFGYLGHRAMGAETKEATDLAMEETAESQEAEGGEAPRKSMWVNDLMNLSVWQMAHNGDPMDESKWVVLQKSTKGEMPWASLYEERKASGFQYTCQFGSPATVYMKTWNYAVPRGGESVFFELPHFQQLIKESCKDEQWRSNSACVVRRVSFPGGQGSGRQLTVRLGRQPPPHRTARTHRSLLLPGCTPREQGPGHALTVQHT